MTSSTTKQGELSEAIKRCEKLARFLNGGNLTVDEYNYNVTLAMAGADPLDLDRCIESIPSNHMQAYILYLRSHLEAVDFMPNPFPFLVGPFSKDEVEQKKKELRPKYQLIYQLVIGRRV